MVLELSKTLSQQHLILILCLLCDNRFHFRIEKAERKTIFDPVFEGRGTVSVRNISIRLRVECRKRRITKLGSDLAVPFLQIKELDIGLEKVKFTVKDTGADWILNGIVKGLARNITEAVQDNLKEQVQCNVDILIENLVSTTGLAAYKQSELVDHILTCRFLLLSRTLTLW